MVSSPFGKAHFRLQKQADFIAGHGQQCVIFPVLQCPCLTPERQFSPLCPGCHGTGRYYPPGSAYAVRLLLVAEDSQRTFEDPGSWTAGTIRATVPVGVHLCERDKVRLLDIKATYTDEVLTKDIDDTLRFGAGVTLLLVADLSQTYRFQTDYILTAPNTVTWVAGGHSPAFGAQYSVKYEAFPEYLVVNDNPRLRVEHSIPQSSEVVLMRLDRLSEEAL